MLWGYDTFAGETYKCGVYRHYSSAYRAKKRHVEDVARTQDERLRDTFWIERTTVEEYNAAEEKKWAAIDAAHESIRHDKALFDPVFDDLASFAKECTKSPGIYKYSLPENLSGTCISDIEVMFKKAYRCRTMYDFTVEIYFKGRSFYIGPHSCSILWGYGKFDEVVERVLKRDLAAELKDFIYGQIEEHYLK